MLSGKSLLITGGTGSLGRALIQKLVDTEVRRIIVFSRDEWKQWKMQEEGGIFRDERLRYFLGDVRDPQRLRRAFAGVDFVIHAAALKQVPAAEYNPSEFIETNVRGAQNLIEAAIDAGVEHIIGLSTDKAAHPVNLYGATKLCSDKLMVAANVYVPSGQKTKFSVVRYGNVLGSRGGVLAGWSRLAQAGTSSLPVTDLRMTRFWITLERAAEFVLQALHLMQGGELFVPKLPSMRLTDLAAALYPHLPLTEIGIRPGEKLHELLIAPEDATRTFDLGDYYVVAPNDGARPEKRSSCWQWLLETGKAPLPDGFSYRSDTNEEWLSGPDLKKLKAA